jgi:methyl-accepting chemotaxis protein
MNTVTEVDSSIGSAEAQLVDATVRERRAQLARGLTRYTTWIGLGLAVLTVGLWFFLSQSIMLLAVAAAAALVGLSAGMYPVLYRRGQANLGIWLFLSAFILAIAAGALAIPGLLPAAVVGYFIVLMRGNLLLPPRARLWLAVVCAAGFAIDIILVDVWAPAWLASIAGTVTLPIGALLSILALIGSLPGVQRTIGGQETYFRQLQLSNLEIEKRVASEQRQRAQLQQANAEVERRAAAEREQRQGLQHVLEQVRTTAGGLGAAAADLLTTTTQQAAGAAEQSAAITQTSVTVDEVRTSSEQTAQRAQGVAEVAQRTSEVSQAGQRAVAGTIDGMQDVKRKVETIATTVLELSERAQAIGQIITTVGDIASQSNMLALNAAVEAARAGEAGRGFAVVAGEVRALADQSRAAAAQIKEILTEIQRGVNTAVMATEEGMKGADAGMRLTRAAGESIERLAEGVGASAQAALHIVAAAEQQVGGMGQIASAMQNIQQVTMQSVAGTRQTEQTAEKLSALAAQLWQVIEQYQVRAAQSTVEVRD